MEKLPDQTFDRPLGSRFRIARTLVFYHLRQLQHAGLCLEDVDGQCYHFGDPRAPSQGTLTVRHPGFYQRVLAQGSIGAGESFGDGWWETEDLTALVRVLARNNPLLDRIESRMGWLTTLGTRLGHWLRNNTRRNARRNIAAHYDLGNDFYRCFLDPQMLYSSALYLDPGDDLATAQRHKLDRLCRQLQLGPDDHLLEIGTGWGALAIHAARHYGCRVTTTTLSGEQYAYARERIAEAGLAEKITLLQLDYRDLTGHYDKLVSVEMIEAVGRRYLPDYIRVCRDRLKPGGLMALQMITMADQRYRHYLDNVDFIQKHIFPGGCLLSVTALLDALTAHSDFVTRDLRDIGLDYARTLADWRQAFNRKRTELAAMGYDSHFQRLWQFYFCYCEGAFRERNISTVQLLASRPPWG